MKRFMDVGMLAFWLLGGCAAHMMLEHPTPYGRDTLNNSPLEASGQDFPCKTRPGVYDLTTMNDWTAGTASSIRFKGSAVHGGGSCQFSITTDAEPSKSSRWKVIDSRVGGCPASANGNLEGGPEAEVADDFEVVLPSQLPDGGYTFAWTWFNRIGDREMYMNCAPITVSGGGSNTTFLDTLPDMFVANLLGSDCTTPANFDFAFPNAGESVVTAKDVKLTPLSEGGGCHPMAATVTSRSTTSSLQAPTKGQVNVDPVRTAAAERESTDAAESARPAPAFTRDAVASPVTDARSSLGVNNVMLGQLSPSTTLAQSVLSVQKSLAILPTSPACIPCSVEGIIQCIGDDEFGLCNHSCMVSQTLAAGTFCSNGAVMRRRGRMLSKISLATK